MKNAWEHEAASILDDVRATGRTTRLYVLFSNVHFRNLDVWAELRKFAAENGLTVEPLKEKKGRNEILYVVFEGKRHRA